MNKKLKKKIDKVKSYSENPVFHKIILALILIYGFILRILHLDHISMWIDETISASASKAILEHGYPMLQSGATYWRAYIFHYLMAGFIWLFRGDFGARLISVVFGVLTIYLAYLFGRKYLKTNFAKFGFAFLVAVSVWQIIYSKQARFYQMFQFFYFLSFFLFYKFVILKEKFFSKRWMDYASVAVSVFVCINTQFMGYILIPLLFLVYLIYNFKVELFKKYWFWPIVLGSVYFGVRAFGIFYGFEWQHAEFYLRMYASYYFSIGVFVVFALAGFVVSLIKNWKLHTSIALISVVPFVGLFFVQVFATRYAYFIVFPMLFYVVALFNEAKIRYVLLVLFVVFQTTLFSFSGIRFPRYDPSMPLADYRGAYDYLRQNESLLDYDVVTTWAPANYWYDFDADYQINYSLSGTSSDFWKVYEGGERFASSKVVNSEEELPSEYVVIIDAQAARKIRPDAYNFSTCENLFSSYDISVLFCSKD